MRLSIFTSIFASVFVSTLSSVILSVLGAGCSSWLAPAVVSSPQARDRPDDEDTAALVPAGVETVIDVDMAALRRSPWTAAVLETSDARAHVSKVEALGYDDLADLDRIFYAVTTAGADAPTLVVARGRFGAARVEDAFRSRWPDAVVDRWRGIPVLTSGENAIALVTPRTFASGAPAAVRAVVDRAFGVGSDIGTDPLLGSVRRALCPAGQARSPAVLATVAIGDRIRARVADTLPLPRALKQVGIRLDVGESLDLQVLGILDDRQEASALARRLGTLLADRDTRLALRAIGLDGLITGAGVTVDGARVSLRTSIGDEHRAAVTESLRTLMASLRAQGNTGGPGSW